MNKLVAVFNKNKKLFNLFLITVQVLFFVTTIVIFYKCLSKGISIAVESQFYLTAICVALLIIMHLSLIRSSANDSESSLFEALIFVDSVHLSLDAQTWLINNMPDIRTYIVIGNVIYYFCPIILAWLLWRFVCQYCKQDKFLSEANRIVNVFTVVGLLMIIGNVKYGYYYTISPSGLYSRSETYPLSLLTIAVVMVTFITTVIKQKMLLRSKIIFLSYPIVPYVGSIITARADGPTLTSTLMFVSIFFIYSNFYVYREQEMAQDKAKYAQKQAELDTAADIQANMLPNVFPAFPERNDFDIYATMDPAKEVGGDFYDFFLLDDNHLAIVIGDVSGKGVPAALFMVIAKTLIKNQSQLGLSPGEIFTRVNTMLCDENDSDLFVTSWMGILDLQTGKLTYVCAGHNPPLVLKKDTGYEWLKGKKGFILAGAEGMKYQENETYLTNGEAIFLYTDGVTEASNTSKELYGENRLINWLNNNKELSPTDILNNLRTDIDEFVGNAEQFDDITMLCVKLN